MPKKQGPKRAYKPREKKESQFKVTCLKKGNRFAIPVYGVPVAFAIGISLITSKDLPHEEYMKEELFLETDKKGVPMKPIHYRNMTRGINVIHYPGTERSLKSEQKIQSGHSEECKAQEERPALATAQLGQMIYAQDLLDEQVIAAIKTGAFDPSVLISICIRLRSVVSGECAKVNHV